MWSIDIIDICRYPVGDCFRLFSSKHETSSTDGSLKHWDRKLQLISMSSCQLGQSMFGHFGWSKTGMKYGNKHVKLVSSFTAVHSKYSYVEESILLLMFSLSFVILLNSTFSLLEVNKQQPTSLL